MIGGVFQPWHLIVILVIVLIVFGPGKLPDLGQSLGRGIREFKSSVKGDEDEAPAKVPSTAASTAGGEPPVAHTAPTAAAPPPTAPAAHVPTAPSTPTATTVTTEPRPDGPRPTTPVV